jgi:hypothetical protein
LKTEKKKIRRRQKKESPMRKNKKQPIPQSRQRVAGPM